MRRAGRAALASLALIGAAPAPTATDYLADARALDERVTAQYAYLDRFPGNAAPSSRQLIAERELVHDRDSLLRYAEDKLASLADHHAITGRSFPDDWALVPSYADLWIERDANGYRIDAVRDGSPAGVAGVSAGDRLIAIDGQPIADAVATFWTRIGRPEASDADSYAARVLAAGRRDRSRVLTVRSIEGERRLTLPSLYAALPSSDRSPLSCARFPGISAAMPGLVVVHFFNSLGDRETIAAFDRCMAALPAGGAVTIDLTDTPSGGNTSVARAIMSWFASRPTAYQVHNLPEEERETGIARQWVEQVLPRSGKHHAGPLEVRVGRWTGSMGEGLAVGLEALGGRVCGTRMAGLRGAVYDIILPATGLMVKLPVERVYTAAGAPRETYVPPGSCGRR